MFSNIFAGSCGPTFRFEITPTLCVGPPGHSFLFGGACLGIAIEAAGRVIGRPVVQASAQFLRFMPCGAMVDLEVKPHAAGRTLAQVAVIMRIAEEEVALVSLGLGQREGFETKQWIDAPLAASADECSRRAILPPQDAKALFLGQIEAREITQTAQEGRTLLWLRRRDGGSNDRMTLASFADFLPLALGRATSRPGGGNSVDNVLRLLDEAGPGWILCDMEISAAAHGFAHGNLKLWSQEGKLLAIGAQSLIQKS